VVLHRQLRPLSVKMLRVVVVTALLALAAAQRWESVEGYTFEEYEIDFFKHYDNEADRHLHKAIFEQNLAQIQRHNADPRSSYKLGVNQFTDLSKEEFKHTLGYSISMANSKRAKMEYAPVNYKYRLEDLPASVDWRNTKPAILTPVKNQGACGSCWAFAATQSIEANVAQNTGTLLVLSTQNVVSCTPNPDHCGGTGGCGGATAELAFDYVKAKGIASNQAYPYRGVTGTCDESIPKVATIKSYVKLIENNYTDLMVAVATVGPVAVSVDASSWGGYSSGIFTGCPGAGQNVDINHAVQLVGYGSQGGRDYWIVRNSWGAGWGEGGFIRILRHSDGDKNKWCNVDRTPGDGSGCDGGPSQVTVCGSCGIWYDNCYPTGGDLKH